MTFKVGQKFVDKHGRVMELVEINSEFEEKYVMSYQYDGDWVVSEFTEAEVKEMKKTVDFFEKVARRARKRNCGLCWASLDTEKEKFLTVANRKYEIDGYIIQYSDIPNYEWYAIVNGKLVDVSEHQWNDFDEFIDVVIEEYQK